jgi:thiosulfate/3-mercaptopyruvate sulfurtransferase
MTPASSQVPEGFADPILLINTDIMETLLDDPNVRIIDARNPVEFKKGHIPGAVNMPTSSLEDAGSRIKGKLSGDTRLANKLGRHGIGKNTHVVVYDAQGGRLAARLLWVLHYSGHQQVSVLEGGLPKWQEEGRPVTKAVVQVSRQTFPFDPVPRLIASADWILGHMHDPNVVLVDLRPEYLYSKAHIPGAINIPWTETLNGESTWWKSPEKLEEIFNANGVTKEKEVVVYAEVGEMSSLGYLILRAHGYPRVRSYDRSWSEWSSDMALPKVGKTPPSGPVLKAIFRVNGCASCHGLSNKPKVNLAGFTELGKEAATLQNGCVNLLTKIVKLAKEDPDLFPNLTKEEVQKTKATFEDHGCVKCHDVDGVGETKANLNHTGLKFQNMNIGCVDMMFSLNN